MILVDTSVWVDHLRQSDVRLAVALEGGQVVIHPFVIGELALGHLRRRSVVLSLLNDLRQSPVVPLSDVLILVDKYSLAGSGIGYVDFHLLAATLNSTGWSLWTRDKRLLSVAERLDISTVFAD